MNFDSSVLQIPIEDIIPNRFQPRLAFEDSSLQELADSIKAHGIIQPLVLRKNGEKYEIVAGERRYKAATMAGLASVPAVITNINDLKRAEVAVVENVQRRPISAVEEARSYKALLDLGYMSKSDLAKRMGLSELAIVNKLKLLTLSPEIQQAILDNQISERHARSLLRISDTSNQNLWLTRIINERLTVRQLDLLLDEAVSKGEFVESNHEDFDIGSISTDFELKPPVSPVNVSNDSVDMLDFTPTGGRDLSQAIKEINNTVNLLHGNMYDINATLEDTPSEKIIRIVIKK